MSDSSQVDHPSHYGGKDDPFEPIKIIKAKKLDFWVGNALKYMLRAGHKPPDKPDQTQLEKEIEDLEKAAWYLNDKIQNLKANAPGFYKKHASPDKLRV